MARACVTRIFTGVPFGAQTAWLDCSRSGMPMEVTRVDAVVQVLVTQGCGVPPGVVKGQPATVCGLGCRHTAWLLTVTRGLTMVG